MLKLYLFIRIVVYYYYIHLHTGHLSCRRQLNRYLRHCAHAVHTQYQGCQKRERYSSLCRHHFWQDFSRFLQKDDYRLRRQRATIIYFYLRARRWHDIYDAGHYARQHSTGDDEMLPTPAYHHLVVDARAARVGRQPPRPAADGPSGAGFSLRLCYAH